MHGLLAAAVLVANPTFFAGPAHAGQSVTYRVTHTVGSQQTPNVSTLVITWTSATQLFARLSGSAPNAAVAVMRSNGGPLSIASPNPNDQTASSVATLLDQLNFPGQLAGYLDGSDHTQMSLSVQPPAPATTASPAAQQSPPPPVTVPVDISLVKSSLSATLIAEGNTNQNASSHSDRGGRGGNMGGGWHGGSMGGWRSGGSGRSQNGSANKSPAVEIAVEAIFDQYGSLEHATYRETFTSTSSGGKQTVEHTITIDRVK